MVKTLRPYGSISEEAIDFLTTLTKGRYALVDKLGNQSVVSRKVFEELKLKGFKTKEVKSRI